MFFAYSQWRNIVLWTDSWLIVLPSKNWVNLWYIHYQVLVIIGLLWTVLSLYTLIILNKLKKINMRWIWWLIAVTILLYVDNNKWASLNLSNPWEKTWIWLWLSNINNIKLLWLSNVPNWKNDKLWLSNIPDWEMTSLNDIYFVNQDYVLYKDPTKSQYIPLDANANSSKVIWSNFLTDWNNLFFKWVKLITFNIQWTINLNTLTWLWEYVVRDWRKLFVPVRFKWSSGITHELRQANQIYINNYFYTWQSDNWYIEIVSDGKNIILMQERSMYFPLQWTGVLFNNNFSLTLSWYDENYKEVKWVLDSINSTYLDSALLK